MEWRVLSVECGVECDVCHVECEVQSAGARSAVQSSTGRYFAQALWFKVVLGSILCKIYILKKDILRGGSVECEV